jgi:hypothetical protein
MRLQGGSSRRAAACPRQGAGSRMAPFDRACAAGASSAAVRVRRASGSLPPPGRPVFAPGQRVSLRAAVAGAHRTRPDQRPMLRPPPELSPVREALSQYRRLLVLPRPYRGSLAAACCSGAPGVRAAGVSGLLRHQANDISQRRQPGQARLRAGDGAEPEVMERRCLAMAKAPPSGNRAREDRPAPSGAGRNLRLTLAGSNK